jgi:hypothetical protein
MLSKLVHKLFPLSVFAYFISLVVTPSAQAISFTGNLSWQGTGNGTTLTGTFSGNDLDSDGFIRGTATGTNELSLFTVTFTDPSVPASATYNLADLLGFGNYNVSTGFLFNYNIASGIISQNAAPTDESDGLSIGDFNNGYVLESSLSAAPNNLSLVDSTVNASGGDSGGTLTATPVPFEFEGSAGILTIGAIWGIKWRKNRIKK